MAAAVFTAGFLAWASPALAAGPALGSRVLHKGMSGPDVKTLQRDLTISGIDTYVSGVFSEGTKIHVKEFQGHHGLAADGVVGPQTAQELKMVAASARHTASAPSGAAASKTSTDAATANSGGASDVPPPADAPVEQATINSQGLAVAPSDAPEVIQKVIAAANKIAFKPYVYGGGHASFNSSGYDCSGSVSYALHGGGLLSSPEDSSQFESYGNSGVGRWITIYTNAGHAYMHIAGLWFDTAAQSSSNGNDRWSTSRISPASGFMVRHPAGW